VTDQLADQLEPSLSRYVEHVCDLLSTIKSRKLVADPHELVESQVRNQVCDLDSLMEFGLYSQTLLFSYSLSGYATYKFYPNEVLSKQNGSQTP